MPRFAESNALGARGGPETPRLSQEDLIVHASQVNAARVSQFQAVLDQGLKDFRLLIVEEFDRQISSGLDSRASHEDLVVAHRVLEKKVSMDPRLPISPTSSETGTMKPVQSLSSLKLAKSRSKIMNPLSRWKRLFILMMRPRAQSDLRDKKFVVHGVWRNYLEMLRRNTSNAQGEFKEALSRISVHAKDNAYRVAYNTLGSSSRSMTMSLVAFSQDTWKCSFQALHPLSSTRLAWSLIALLLVLFDTAILPVSAFFAIEDAHFFDIVSWCGICFWIIDIPMNFISGKYVDGVVETKLYKIARLYARSWLLFDCTMVLTEWVLLVLTGFTSKRSLVSLQAEQSIRVLRLIRLFRLTKIPTMFQDYLQPFRHIGILQTLFLYVVYFHFLACSWYGIGGIGDDGWAKKCDTYPAFSANCYLTALHWAVSSVHGSTSEEPSTTVEWTYSVVTLFIGLLLFALILERISAFLASYRSDDKKKLRQRCETYSRKHTLSSDLTHRLLSYIDFCNKHADADLSHRIAEENTFLTSIPKVLRNDVLLEARSPLIVGAAFVSHLHVVSPKIVMLICAEAMISTICLVGQLVFSTGDVGNSWRIVESGCLVYNFGLDMWTDFVSAVGVSKSFEDLSEGDDTRRIVVDAIGATRQGASGVPRKSISTSSDATNSVNLMNRMFPSTRTSKSSGPSSRTSKTTDSYQYVNNLKGKKIYSNMRISEMVLWTEWVHAGDLIALYDSIVFYLDVDSFYNVLKGRIDTCVFIARYAEMYVKQLRGELCIVSDLYEYEPDLVTELGNLSEYKGGLTHLAFISHYKEEAGTEATLMQEALETIIARGGFESDEEMGVFLDSENLTDLARLRDNVKNSHNLLLLLTPRVLLRPWCLVEIATAIEHGIEVVPIEVQRPGISFQYPDDEFYRKLHRGDLLESHDAALLMTEGISFSQIEEAVRSVFRHIALPFSPHKSRAVRDAEVQDILKRCLLHK